MNNRLPLWKPHEPAHSAQRRSTSKRRTIASRLRRPAHDGSSTGIRWPCPPTTRCLHPMTSRCLRRSYRKVTAGLLSLIVVASRGKELLPVSSHRASIFQYVQGGGQGGLFAHVPAPPSSARLGRLRTSGLWTSGVYHQNAQSAGRAGCGVRRRGGNACGRSERVHSSSSARSRMEATAAGGEGEGRRRGRGGPRPKKRPLGFLCGAVNDAILEMCVVNKGRPLARSMTDFVEYSIEALASGE